MGKKEDGLWQGTLVFITIFVFGAAILGQYVYSVTKERS